MHFSTIFIEWGNWNTSQAKSKFAISFALCFQIAEAYLVNVEVVNPNPGFYSLFTFESQPQYPSYLLHVFLSKTVLLPCLKLRHHYLVPRDKREGRGRMVLDASLHAPHWGWLHISLQKSLFSLPICNKSANIVAKTCPAVSIFCPAGRWCFHSWEGGPYPEAPSQVMPLGSLGRRLRPGGRGIPDKFYRKYRDYDYVMG